MPVHLPLSHKLESAAGAMNAVGGRFASGEAMRALVLRRSGGVAEALRGSVFAVSQVCVFGNPSL